MVPDNEQHFAYSKGENNETAASPRHEVTIEEESTATESERAQWLDRVFGAGFKGEFDSHENPMDAAAAQEMLDDWKATVPAEHHSMINELRGELNVQDGTGKAIPQIVIESLRDGNWQKIDDLQELCVAVLGRYDSTEGRTGWQKLPEINKRYIRMAEMSVLMIDAITISRDATTGGADDDHLKRMMQKLDRYATGTDIPDSFRRGLSKPFRRDQPDSADDSPRSTPPVKRQRQSAGRPSDSAEPVRERPDGDFVDTTYNPLTGAYEPIDDSSANPASKPRPTSASDKSGSEPGSPPPTTPAAET